MGFIGASCEQDLDECSTGLHGCKESSECVNMPGWYFCKCKHGYHTLGPECIDIDECKHQTHSCHPTATCVNTEGHFECHCSTASISEECSLSKFLKIYFRVEREVFFRVFFYFLFKVACLKTWKCQTELLYHQEISHARNVHVSGV